MDIPQLILVDCETGLPINDPQILADNPDKQFWVMTTEQYEIFRQQNYGNTKI